MFNLGQNNSVHQHRLRTESGVQPCRKGLGILAENKLGLCQQCSPEVITLISLGPGVVRSR